MAEPNYSKAKPVNYRHPADGIFHSIPGQPTSRTAGSRGSDSGRRRKCRFGLLHVVRLHRWHSANTLSPSYGLLVVFVDSVGTVAYVVSGIQSAYIRQDFGTLCELRGRTQQERWATWSILSLRDRGRSPGSVTF